MVCVYRKYGRLISNMNFLTKKINCLVCETTMFPFFKKSFDKKRWGFAEAEYVLCENCGFSACKTHYEMSDKQWSVLNEDFHTSIYDVPGDPYGREDRLTGQAKAIRLMIDFGLIARDAPLVDWGSGLGDLANRLMKKQVFMYSYDKYIKPFNNPLPEALYNNRSFTLVTACAVMEHLRDRETLDEIESLVSNDGILAIHMAIPDVIPKDPDWVYLLPVHCSFYTSKTMLMLMKQWNYKCAAYCAEAKMWFFFKNNEGVLDKITEINRQSGGDFLYYSDGYITPQAVEMRLALREQPEVAVKLFHGKGEAFSGWLTASANSDVHFIYVESLLEEMSLDECKKFLKESFDKLVEGGVLRVVTIDLRKHVDMYLNRSYWQLDWVRSSEITAPAEYLNTLFHNLGFRSIYDIETMKKIMSEVGFRNILSLEKGKSRYPIVRDIDRLNGRLYIEAVK